MAWIFTVFLLGVYLVGAEEGTQEEEGGKCERIRLPLCQDLGYNWTAMPNLLGHKDQKEAEEAMAAFSEVLSSGCSQHTRFVLCSAFAPLCSAQVTGAVSACRALCEDAVRACGAPLAALSCDAFPERADRRLCMRPPPPEPAVPPPPAPHWPPAPPPCPPHMRRHAGACLPACTAPAPAAAAGLTALAWLALLATLFALVTFCAEPARYRYPERPGVWLAACQLVVAAAHVGRGWLGAGAGCAGPVPDVPGAPACVAFFSLTYYFTLAGDAWLANACGAWYLTAASEWSTEALERAAAYLHAAAWGWAGAWTAAALALRRVATHGAAACALADDAAAPLLLVPRAAPLLAALALGAAAAPGVRRVRRALGGVGARRVGRLAARAAAVGVAYGLLAALAVGARLWEARARATGGEAAAGSAASTAATLAGGVAAAAWAWSRKSAAAWRRALVPPRKARVPAPPLLPPHPYCKRPLHVSRV